MHPGFAASWYLGCQDISLEDNENICYFSSKTKYRLKEQGEEQAKQLQSRQGNVSPASKEKPQLTDAHRSPFLWSARSSHADPHWPPLAVPEWDLAAQ